MPRLVKKAQAFLNRFADNRETYILAAAKLQGFIAKSIADLPIAIHVTVARSKTAASLRRKCRQKGYKNPAVQVTDLLAVRVITYFKGDVDAVADRLRRLLDISERKSRDARKQLTENQFGYRSVHLIARLRPRSAEEQPEIGRRWFEIQIRSILDHAWSEIEHEIIYKSGIEYPKDVRRRFKALAASLETLEDSFAILATERDKLIEGYALDYRNGVATNKRFDVARMQACLEVLRPSGVSWRAAEKSANPFPHGIAPAALEALGACALNTARRLQRVIGSKRFRETVMRFASLEGIASDTVSHLAIIVLAVAVTKPDLLREQFPDIVFSPVVTKAANIAL